MASSDPAPAALLHLSPDDNVLVVAGKIEAGCPVEIDGTTVQLDEALGFGHKVAARAIATGEKIIKCRTPIGSATQDIAAGEHVHLHNMKSDYLPTFIRSDMEGEDH